MPAKAVGQAAQMLNVPTPSRASPLPQGISSWIGIRASPQNTVGAWLARDSGGSGNMDFEWTGVFASRLAPTGIGGVHSNRAHHKITVGACLQAIAVGQATWILNGLASSRAGSLPQGSGGGSRYPVHPVPKWERGLPAKAVGQAAQMLNGPTPSRASSLPQGISAWIGICASPQNTAGAWLARESGGSGDRDVERAAAFASKPAPTGSGGVHSNRAHHKITVGACLQAIAVGQAAQMLNVPTPSRASPLPQVPRRPGVYSVIFEKLR